ncbi:hypothetical protein ACFWYW_15140 [Nonomuraea sp. NPDC059023]|uniref:hypothetical protein n=1 Tax=unclassified Nonomuraea TaxID=2593643 RepID=UPI0036BC4323
MSGPESVTCHEDLVKLLAEQFARADVSLRELQTRAERAGGARLPRTTCADMLAGRRFPKKAVMLAFLRGCRVPDAQLPAWERAWDRVRVGRLPPGTSGEPPVLPGRVWTVRRWRRAGLLAAMAVATVAISLGVTAQRVTPQRGPSAGVPGSFVGASHIVSDDGRSFPRGGSSRFTVRVDPASTRVRLVRRLDVGVGLQHATISVNGVPAAEWRPLLEDAVYKWRDQVVTLPPHLTAGRDSLTIVNTSVSASGFNEFFYTVENEVDGGWTVADRLDVGRGHVAGEAAHGYRVAGEDWADVQTFAYPPRRADWRVR